MVESRPPTGQIVRFGVFELDLRTGELRRSGLRVGLQDQPLQVLTLLLERRGELVTREELRLRLWPADTFVDFEQGLNAAVKRLRTALGDSADVPRFIETLPRRGYRWIPAAEPADRIPDADPIPVVAPPRPPRWFAPDEVVGAGGGPSGAGRSLIHALEGLTPLACFRSPSGAAHDADRRTAGACALAGWRERGLPWGSRREAGALRQGHRQRTTGPGRRRSRRPLQPDVVARRTRDRLPTPSEGPGPTRSGRCRAWAERRGN